VQFCLGITKENKATVTITSKTKGITTLVNVRKALISSIIATSSASFGKSSKMISLYTPQKANL